MTINTPFQKRYVLSPSVFTSSHPTEERGSQAHFQLSIIPKSMNRNTPMNIRKAYCGCSPSHLSIFSDTLSISRHYFVNGPVAILENGLLNLASDLYDTVYVRIDFQAKYGSVFQMVVIYRSIVIGCFNNRIIMSFGKTYSIVISCGKREGMR